MGNYSKRQKKGELWLCKFTKIEEEDASGHIDSFADYLYFYEDCHCDLNKDGRFWVSHGYCKNRFRKPSPQDLFVVMPKMAERGDVCNFIKDCLKYLAMEVAQ